MDANNHTNTNDFDKVIITTEPDGWLPGLAPCQSRGGGTQAPPGADAMPNSAAAWWVRSSEKQARDGSGVVNCLTHQLMFGKKSIKKGTGHDCYRTFAAQAAFLNIRKSKPASGSSKRKSTRFKKASQTDLFDMCDSQLASSGSDAEDNSTIEGHLPWSRPHSADEAHQHRNPIQ